MKMQWKSALTAGVITMSLAGAVNAEEEKGFYIGGSAYYTQVFDADTTVEVGNSGLGVLDPIPVVGPILGGLLGPILGGGSAAVGTEYEFDEDFAYGFSAGYKFLGPWRGELEYRFGENDIEDTLDPAIDSLETESLMASLWYDFRMEEALRPYVGFGLGMANLDIGPGDDDVFIGQLGAGVSYHLSPRLVLDAGYRYAMAEDPSFKYGDVRVDSEYESQSLLIGMRYNFFDAQYGVQDEDGDGVPDEADQCPGTPRGVQVDSEGCPLDGDNDGVADYLDQCPNTPAGTKVNDEGCSIDSDGDGVADDDDMCPNTPEGQRVMSNGCGEAQSVVLRGVTFELDSAQLTVNAETILDGVATTLGDSPGFDVEVQGHTDSTGSSSYNMNLSQNRAESVKTYLVDKGISSSRLSARGYGEDQPVASNDTREGRAENRRVELKVVGQDDGVMMEEEVYMPSDEEESEDPYDYYMPAEEDTSSDEDAATEDDAMTTEDDFMMDEESTSDDDSTSGDDAMTEEDAAAEDFLESSAEDDEDPLADDYDYEYMPGVDDDEQMEP